MPTLADLFRARYSPGGTSIDFESIRLHYTGADASCRALNARAFTVGADIYFADGAFSPQTRAGLWLLAHEVAHVVQQAGDQRPGPGPVGVAAARSPHEQAADAAADAFMTGRSFLPGTAGPSRRPLIQRYMAWEHAMLGDLTADDVRILAARGLAPSPHDDRAERTDAYCGLLEGLGTNPREVGRERLHRGPVELETVTLPGSGLTVTLGELSVLADYLGHPREIEDAPAAFMEPLVQSVRSWSIDEIRRSRGQRRPPHGLPGALPYTRLGRLAEMAEVPAVDRLGQRNGFTPSHQYSSVLARNAGHFAPFSWYRWHSFHLQARELIGQSATASEQDRERLRRRARIYAGYADHFLQDSFAAGHLINKTLVMQWYIEWLAGQGVPYPHDEVLGALTVARQPRLHGAGHYDRAYARLGERVTPVAGGTAAGLAAAGLVPRPPWDPQDLAELPSPADRMAVSGLVADGPDESAAVYAAYLTMLSSGTVQIASKVAHDYLNRRSLVVSPAPDGPRFRLFGDHSLFRSADGAGQAARAAEASRRAISDLLRHGRTSQSSWDIFDSFPSQVEHHGRLLPIEEWHHAVLRDLCFRDLFGRLSTRAMRVVMSGVSRTLGTPTDDG